MFILKSKGQQEAILHQLRGIGVRIAAIDLDLVEGETLQIAQRGIVGSEIVQAVVKIAAALKMTTAAEGVETATQRELLRELGCTEMQGYLFSAPKPATEVKRLFGTAEKTTIVAA